MKIIPHQALKIFRDRRSPTIIAAEYGVSADTIRDIKLGRSWSHITGKVHRSNRRKPKRKRLTTQEAQAIFVDPRPHTVIAKQYGFDTTTIYQIKAGKSYQWATGWPHARAVRNRVGRPRKLTPEQREAICQDRRTQRAIAAAYGVSRDCICKIKKSGQRTPS